MREEVEGEVDEEEEEVEEEEEEEEEEFCVRPSMELSDGRARDCMGTV